MMIRGSVDSVTSTEIRGWAFAADRKLPVLVQAILNREIVGEATATIHRPDLAAAGLGDGNSGYVIKLYRSIDPLYLPFLSVTIDGGDAELPRSTMLGYGEFFRALYATHPNCGRSRSVFGGLWTDRTDAIALLSGKARVHQISSEDTSRLEEFIRNGFTIWKTKAAATEAEWRAAARVQADRLLQNSDIRRFIRRIFEDDPVVMRTYWYSADNAGVYNQPSARNPSPSFVECVDLVVTFGEDTSLQFVRDSHELPEFTTTGSSRWVGIDPSSRRLQLQSEFMLRVETGVGHVSVIGPGTIYSCDGSQCASIAVTCIPLRAEPAILKEPSEF